MEQHSQEFMRRAVAEARRYGDDPWVLLRELGQNARDARARHIAVSTRERDGKQVLTFSDDGRGMSLEHARAYLFRLYASSKGEEADSAGRFGVGFWSVLLFCPERIEIHSRCRSEAWGVALRGDLGAWERVECRRRQVGTTVVLERRTPPGGAPLATEVAAGIERYLAHLRTAGMQARPLPVSLDGQPMQREFSLPGPGTMRFRDGPVEGVVGFGPRPAYRLYARGLPVAEGAYLEELEGRPDRPGAETEREGVAPVFLLNGNKLNVVLSRQTVVRDRALQELIRIARLRFDQLVSETIEGAAGRSLWRRLAAGIRRRLARYHGPRWLVWTASVLALLLVGGLFGVGLSWWPGGQGAAAPVAPAADPVGLQGPVRDPEQPRVPAPVRSEARVAFAGTLPPGPDRAPLMRPSDLGRASTGTVALAGGESTWSFEYSPPDPLYFRTGVLDRFVPERGWVASGRFEPTAAGEAGAGDARALVRVVVRHPPGPGQFLLPVPTGYRPAGERFSLGGRALPFEVDRRGQVRVSLPVHGRGPLRYALKAGRRPPPGLRQTMLARIPQDGLPDAFTARLERLSAAAEPERLQGAVELVQEFLIYDRSSATVQAYQRRAGDSSAWIPRVLAIGAGDCDVINGLLAVALRRLDIPARLAVGIVGQDGRGLPGLHAWVEVILDGQLVAIDASIGARRRPIAAVDARPAPAPPEAVGAGERAAGVQAAPQERPSRAAGLDRRGRVLVYLLGGLGALAATLLVLLIALRLRHREGLRMSGDGRKRRRLLAGMALDALRRPRAWKHVPGIWNRPILPCLGDRHISLARLIRSCRDGQAFLSTRQAALVPEALASRAILLDAQDPDFGGLYARTSQLRNLDELDRFRPAGRDDGDLQPLIAALDDLLARKGARAACRLVAGEAGAGLCWDVDLAPIRPGRRSVWPARFVAVNPAHPLWRQLSSLFARKPGLALAVAVDHLIGASGLLDARSEQLRLEAARIGLRGAP